MLWVGESIPIVISYEGDSVKVNLLCRYLNEDGSDSATDWKLHARN